MSLQHAAQHIASHGRGEDKVLVHMTPKEVAGLQALALSHGGSLTINPATGLPEAGFLSSLLPAIAGIALNAIFPGSGALIGLGVGGATALATGSLSQGLMAGLGAYGGAGFGNALIGAGTAASTAPLMDVQAMLDPGISTATAAPALAASPWDLMGKGLTSIFDSGSAGSAARNALLGQAANAKTGAEATGLGGWPGAIKSAGMLALPIASAIKPEQNATKKPVTYMRPYDLKVTNTSGGDPYGIGSSQEQQMLTYDFVPQEIYQAAEGGLAALQEGGSFDDSKATDMEPGYASGGETKRNKPLSLKGDKIYKFADDRRDASMEAAIEQNFAKGGLPSALPPRFLSGGGDGMSDSIKANIDGKQEARLADGEFVVPADVVSHLGNGSSKAGAKRLYAMMDRVRKARTGRERQAPEVNVNRYMPA